MSVSVNDLLKLVTFERYARPMADQPVTKKRANLRDVARVSGVSVATVSRVLNSPGLVQNKTRQRVEAVIEELGFVRNAAARAINSGRSRILGALVPTLDNDIFAMTLNAMENRLVELGFSLVVATTDEDPEKEALKARELLENGVEGLVLTGTTHIDALYKMLERWRVPAVVISCFDPKFRLPTIGYDNHFAASLAHDHLIACGHRRIAILHGPSDNNDRTLERLEAITRLKQTHLHDLFETALSVGGGAKAVQTILAGPQRYDAILCLSDVLAFGALNELQRAGLKVPEDISVIGIHDLPASKDTYPRLTTVHLPVRQMGRHAADALARWVQNDARPDPVYIPSSLVRRETVGKTG